jgi:hypothetical protein
MYPAKSCCSNRPFPGPNATTNRGELAVIGQSPVARLVATHTTPDGRRSAAATAQPGHRIVRSEPHSRVALPLDVNDGSMFSRPWLWVPTGDEQQRGVVMIDWVHSVDVAVQSAKSSQKFVLLDFFSPT